MQEHVLLKIRRAAICPTTSKIRSSCAGVTLLRKAHPTVRMQEVEILQVAPSVI
jgi:hypothetical protein